MNWVHYILQVNIYLVVFYGFYKLLLDKETYFMLNRIYLLSAGVFSISIPFLRFEWFASQTVSQPIYMGAYQLNSYISDFNQAPSDSYAIWIGSSLVLVYITGVILFTSRLIVQVIKASSSLKTTKKGAAFSFLNRKSIDPDLPNLDIIHQHEDIHIKQWHTADVLFFEVLTILNWFNPILYFYKRSIRNLHEYLADEQAANFQGDKEEYAMLLLSSSFQVPRTSLNNHFFTQSQLKKRITMLYKEKSKKRAVLKYGLFLPLFALTLTLSSATLRTNDKVAKLTDGIPLNTSFFMSNGLLDQNGQPRQDKVYDFVSIEKQPEFKGGMKKFYEYLHSSVKYPESAVKNNIQGKVFLSFIVEKDGKLNNIHVDRKLGYGTDEEAVRVLEESPNWDPGLVKGKPVRVKYNIPISFSLSK